MLPMRIIFAKTIQYDSAFQQIALSRCHVLEADVVENEGELAGWRRKNSPRS
jgi:hypothetical protein